MKKVYKVLRIDRIDEAPMVVFSSFEIAWKWLSAQLKAVIKGLKKLDVENHLIGIKLIQDEVKREMILKYWGRFETIEVVYTIIELELIEEDDPIT